MNIHRKGGNHLKSKASIRQVPVHPKLEELGLSELIKEAKKRPDQRLFWDIERGAEGKFTPAFSRRFSRYSEKIGIKTETTSFHSFRHNFCDAAGNAFAGTEAYSADEITCGIGGWSYGSGAQKSYGSGLWMAKKFEAIQKIAYPDVSFDTISIVGWQR